MEAKDSQERQKLVVLIVVGVLYSIGLTYAFETLSTLRVTSDLFPRWYASRMFLTIGRSVYDWANASEVAAITGWPFANHLGYYYPAYLLIFTVPLSILPYEVAHFVWTVFGLWCLWVGMLIFARLFIPGLSINRLTLLLFLVTLSVPVFQHTLYAQFNTIGVLALALVCRALYREEYLLAGLWAGGFLFKPQAIVLPLLFFLIWSVFKRERWRFWLGLGVIAIFLWGVGELFESNWVVNFWHSLDSYEAVRSVIDILFWNPYQLISLTLFGLMFWLIFRFRYITARDTSFYGLLTWTICLNALTIPMFGMLHLVFIGPILVIVLSGYKNHYPIAVRWMWLITIGLLVSGFLAFISPLLLTDTTSLQIDSSERVYRFVMPILYALISLPLIFVPKDLANEAVNHRSRL